MKIKLLIIILVGSFIMINFSVASERFDPVDNALQKYRKGEYESARKELAKLIDKYVKNYEQYKCPSDAANIISDISGISSYEFIYFGSLNETNSQRQISIEFLRPLINTMENIYKSAKNMKQADRELLGFRELNVERCNIFRSIAIKQYIKLNKKDKRAEIYDKHKKLLQKKEQTLKNINDEIDIRALEIKEKKSIKIAEKDLEAIKIVLKSYYNSLLTGNFTSKKSHFSKKTTVKDLKKLEDKYKHERDVEKDFDSIESVEINSKTNVKITSAKNDYIIIHVSGVSLKFKKDGKTQTTTISDVFKMIKEDNGWVIWAK